MEEDHLKVFTSRLLSEIELLFHIETNEDKFYVSKTELEEKFARIKEGQKRQNTEFGRAQEQNKKLAELEMGEKEIEGKTALGLKKSITKNKESTRRK